MNIFEYALAMLVYGTVQYWYIVFPAVFCLGLLTTYLFVIRRRKPSIPDVWEKAFGKAPRKGYIIKNTEVELVDNDTFKGFIVNWVAQGIGFGQLFFGWGLDVERLKDYPKQRGFHCSTECMSDEFVEAVIKKAQPQILEIMCKHRTD